LRFGPLYVAYAVPNPSFDDQRKTAAFATDFKNKFSDGATGSGKENLVLHLFARRNLHMKITKNLGTDGVF
jgi:hypothetical protein